MTVTTAKVAGVPHISATSPAKPGQGIPDAIVYTMAAGVPTVGVTMEMMILHGQAVEVHEHQTVTIPEFGIVGADHPFVDRADHGSSGRSRP